jgi:hypothetical protein
MRVDNRFTTHALNIRDETENSANYNVSVMHYNMTPLSTYIHFLSYPGIHGLTLFTMFVYSIVVSYKPLMRIFYSIHALVGLQVESTTFDI